MSSHWYLAAAALWCASGCAINAMMKDVPPTFAELAQPITLVAPSPEDSTVVLIRDPPLDSLISSQALTVILENGHALGQVLPHSFTVAHIAPGTHSLVQGSPEVGYREWCAQSSADFRSGKVYLFNVDTMTLVEPDDSIGRRLSKLSYLTSDAPRGTKEVRAQWESYWQGCIKSAANRESELRKTEYFKKSQSAAAAAGMDGLTIPGPP